jgi:diguanylate cyclase (GGDEF)-like protein/PAS domain S-box-containing protein
MRATRPLPGADANQEVSALIATLHQTGQRLEELTSGEVDTVAGDDGRTFLLLRAQEQLRHIDAARQSAIINALPAHIALLDGRGVIVSVNGAWQAFACENAAHGPGHGVGGNYLEICDGARGEGSHEAHQAAEGIRSVLGGWAKSFSLEYVCHSASGERWFRMMATPLAAARPNGVVVMHLDVTREREAKEGLLASESRFRQMAESIRDVFFLRSLDGSQMHYVSPAYEQIWGRTCESLYDNPASWSDSIHPMDLAHVAAKFTEGGTAGFDYEFRIVRPDGELRWIHARGFPVLDAAGKPYRTAGVASDITRRKQVMEELHRSESLKGAIVEASLDCVVTIDHEGKIVEFNPAAVATFGFTRAQVLGRSMVDLIIPPRFRDAHNRGFARFLATGKGQILGKRLELAAIRADGTEFPVELAIASIAGAPAPMFTAFLRDITARKEAEGRIKRLNRVYAVLSGINTLIVRVRDRDELFREACRIAVEQGGFRMAWIGLVESEPDVLKPMASAGDVGDFFAARAARTDKPGPMGISGRAMRTLKPVISNDMANDPERRMKKEMQDRGINSVAVLPLVVAGQALGNFFLYSADIGFFDDEEMRLLEELAGDIAFAIDHIGKLERINYLAYYDSLTGLANRSLFLERVTQHLRAAASNGHRLAVFLLDLERFKNINDSLGQTAGDALLRQVGEWITRSMGDASLVARLGADHFAVVLPQVKEEGNVVSLVEKTLQAFFEHPFRLDDAVLRIAAKVGVAIFPDDGSDADTLLKNAEAALKKSKASGARYLFYTRKMTETVAAALTLENQLRRALDNEEFVLHYQPKVSLASGKLTSAEALIRWNDPATGLVPPGRFIPILEETGLIHEVGRWALRKAIDDYLRWRAAGLAAVRIAVNVSPLQVRDRGFIEEIRRVIAVDPHAAAGLELELTESLIMEDVKHSIASLQAIRAMGVKIAIDDFGTGFSSLSYLAKLPVDTLKIDRSFVNDMTEAPEGLALVSTIISLAHSLKLKVVAEGVETEEQSRLLRLLNCDETQGFLFSKPVPAGTFEERFLVALAPAST